MAYFIYRALDRNGIMYVGKAVEENETALHERLREEGNYLVDVKTVQERKKFHPMDARALSEFCRELGVMLNTGAPLASVMQVLSAAGKSTDYNGRSQRSVSRIYRELFREIRKGFRLSEAMESMNPVFPMVLIQMFRAAEEQGNLAGAALHMADHYQNVYRMQERVKSAAWYPKFLLALIMISVSVLLGYVLPQLELLFTGLEEMPWPTRVLYGIAAWAQRYRWCIPIMAAAVILMVNLGRKNRIIRILGGMLEIRLPVLGYFHRTIYSARFAQVLSTLYLSGLPMLFALTAARDTIGNAWMERRFEAVLAGVRGGDALSAALGKVDGFQEKLVDAVRLGEESDCLETMLRAVADDLNYESELLSGRAVLWLEPCLILVMALIVGFVMIAVMLPVYESYTAMELAVYR